MKTLIGISASKGIAIGQLFIKTEKKSEIEKVFITNTENEIERFHVSQKQSVKQLNELFNKAKETTSEEEAQIFDIHAMMVEDLDYSEGIENIIKSENVNAEYAVSTVGKQFSQVFAEMDNEYMRARSVDVLDISSRIIDNLTGEVQTQSITEQVIYAAADLTPSETILLDKNKVLAFVTKLGSKISHSAILARTIGLPAVVGLGEKYDYLRNGDIVIIDGYKGEIIVEPDQQTLQEYTAKLEVDRAKREKLKSLIGKETISADGQKIELCANIGHIADIKPALDNDAEGIGLFRSEFIYMESTDFPTEEHQFEIYKRVLTQMNGKRVIIRTLDLGADKHADYFDLPKEDNPAMGYRAIRICLKEPNIFTTQLRALLRASVYGRLAIMFPMIISLEEVIKIKEILNTIKRELKKENIPYSDSIEIGVMIETPAAVMLSDLLAKEVDFFSIGTNDLTQYTLACDRMNSKLTDIYNPRSKAILRMIAITVENAHKEGIWVGICGESAGDSELLSSYLAIGVDELSVSPASILEIRNKVLHSKAHYDD